MTCETNLNSTFICAVILERLPVRVYNNCPMPHTNCYCIASLRLVLERVSPSILSDIDTAGRSRREPVSFLIAIDWERWIKDERLIEKYAGKPFHIERILRSLHIVTIIIVFCYVLAKDTINHNRTEQDTIYIPLFTSS